jgi:flagellar biosynthesis/type III secretory pathway protein FliH
VFKKFFEVAEIAAFSETERYDYEENLKNYNDWFSVMNTAKNEGIAEGRAEGRAEGLAEGRAEGEAIGMEKGRAEGRMEGELAMLTKLVLANKEKGKTSSEIAEMLDVDINLVDDILNGKR